MTPKNCVRYALLIRGVAIKDHENNYSRVIPLQIITTTNLFVTSKNETTNSHIHEFIKVFKMKKLQGLKVKMFFKVVNKK